MASAVRSKPHMDDRGVSNLRHWFAFLFAVGHQSLVAALVCAGCIEGVALSTLCALEHGIALGATVVSVFGRTAFRPGRAMLGLGRRLWTVSGLLLFQRSKRSARDGPCFAETNF